MTIKRSFKFTNIFNRFHIWWNHQFNIIFFQFRSFILLQKRWIIVLKHQNLIKFLKNKFYTNLNRFSIHRFKTINFAQNADCIEGQKRKFESLRNFSSMFDHRASILLKPGFHVDRLLQPTSTHFNQRSKPRKGGHFNGGYNMSRCSISIFESFIQWLCNGIWKWILYSFTLKVEIPEIPAIRIRIRAKSVNVSATA